MVISYMVGEVEMAKRKRKRHLKKRVYVFILILFIGGCSLYYNHQHQLAILQEQQRIEEERIKKEKEEKYEACLTKKYEESELTSELLNQKNEIDTFIKTNNYKASVLYEDIQTGFNYKYDAEKVYYGCSLIKIVDALYLINQATLGNVNLDTETITYTSNYVRGFSSGMEKRKIGEQVTLRDLITYAISVSDNSAHLMLLDYIGFSNLKNYGQSLGAKVILTGGDNYGNQTAEDTNIYLKEAYKIITENQEYGPFLKSIMDNNERNAFNTDTIKIYHKYGSYAQNYHDIGLSLEEHPYAISILTLHENNGYQEVVQGIHEKVRALHNAFYENRKNACYQEVYGN